jgi:hypothetical protein
VNLGNIGIRATAPRMFVWVIGRHVKSLGKLVQSSFW